MDTKPRPHQVARRKLREHWYLCKITWPYPFVHCSPGYSHPRCEEGQKLEKDFIEALTKKQNTVL